MPPIDKNKFFRQATIKITGSLEIETSLKQTYDFLSNFMPITQIYLLLFEPSSYTLKTVGCAPKLEEQSSFDHVILPAEIRDKFISGWKDDKNIIILNRPEQETVSEKLVKKLPNKGLSFLTLLLTHKGERLGALSVYTDAPDQYTEEHGALLSLLNEPFSIAMSNTLKHHNVIKLKEKLEDDNQYLHQELFKISGDKIIGADTGLKGVMEMARHVAPLNSPVLLIGETGVGKEVIANDIHFSSKRKNGPFIKVNCGAIPENLIDSELFGHEKGAFTGALNRKRGRFERAHNGTIFLDEIGELPLQVQVRILRVIQFGEIERVGGTTPVKINIRIISATHRNLQEMVQSNDFREDLWYRLNVFPIIIPPLRHRKEDIPALIHYFVKRKADEIKLHQPPQPGHDTINKLQNYAFPGNVRELENMIERSLILSQNNQNDAVLNFDQFISQHHNKDDGMEPIENNDLPSLDEMNRIYIGHVLKKTNGIIGGKNGAAKILKLNQNTLRSRMKKLGLLK